MTPRFTRLLERPGSLGDTARVFAAHASTGVLTLTLMLAALSGTLRPSSAEEPLSPALLLERGIYEETAELEFPKALRTFEAARSHPEAGPRTKVEATLRMAECHDVLEHPLAAWVHFDEVMRSNLAPAEFAVLAMEQKVLLLVEIAESGTPYSRERIHHAGDLILALDGALSNHESHRAERLLPPLASALEALRLEAEVRPDRKILNQMLADVALITSWLQNGHIEKAQEQFAARSYRSAFVHREALSGEDEVFGYAMEYLDEVIRSINANNAVQAHQNLETFESYLRPLNPWPVERSREPEYHAYLSKLIELARDLEPSILRNELREARLKLDEFLSFQAQTPMPHWHLDPKTLKAFINPEVLPHYAAMSVLVDAAAEAIKTDEIEKAKDRIRDALRRIDVLKQSKAGTSDEGEARQFHRHLQDLRQLLNEGQGDEALSAIETRNERRRNKRS